MNTPVGLANDRIRIDVDTRDGLRSVVDVATEREFIHPGAPLYRIVLARGAETRTITNRDAEHVETDVATEDGARRATFRYRCHAGLDLDVTCTVALDGTNLSRWRIAVRNGTDYSVRAAIYPVVYAVPALGESDEDDVYVSGTGFGLIARHPGRTLLDGKRQPARPSIPDELRTDFCPSHHPGPVAVQMHCYYDGTAGLYMATEDADGRIKRFTWSAAEDADAIDLSVHHHYDERPGLCFALPYDTVVGTFRGDWYDAADIYGKWAHRQRWCAKKLGERDDIPSWFTEPRLHLMVISRGGVDRAQATLPTPPSECPLGNVWPARKTVALMRRFRDAFAAPVLCWLEGWEKIGAPGGPVEIFPPYEGEESFMKALAELKADDIPTQLYLAGLHWCYRRASTGYYGEERWEREGKALSTVDPDGSIAHFVYPSAQKHFTNLCVGAKGTRELFLNNFAELVRLGATWIQIDQQVALYVQPCWSESHGHPPGYGPWMFAAMRDFVRDIRRMAKERNPDAAFTCENACEIWIDEIDGFMSRPYLMGDVLHALPIFEYVYHEYAIVYGGDMAQWFMHPEAACIKHAHVAAYGLQNLVTINEPDYDIDTPEVEHPAVPLLASISRAQRTYARDYLVFGRMLRPASLDVRTRKVEFWWPPQARIRDIHSDVPHVVHSSWRAQDGRVGHVLINWTGESEAVGLTLAGNRGADIVSAMGRSPAPAAAIRDGKLTVAVPPRSLVLVEEPAG